MTDMASLLGGATAGYVNDDSVNGTFSIAVTSRTTVAPEDDVPESRYAVWQQVVISIILVCMILSTIVGNSLVCIAVGIVKRLRTPSNLLIVSLAVADLLVAILVMPFALYFEIRTKWRLGTSVCDMWTSLDVLLCTASILNLCMISVDRYFVITKPLKYALKRTPKRMGLMIAVVWVTSALISIPPIFGWKAHRKPLECFISNDLGYQIYATLGAFYLPLTVMIVVYYKIWRVSSRICKAEHRSQIGSIDRTPDLHVARPSRDSGDSHLLPNGSIRDANLLSSEDDTTRDNLLKKSNSMKRRRFTLRSIIPSRTHRNSFSGERKATKTLGIIMGCFTACWLPFFILAVVRAVCEKVYGDTFIVPDWITSLLMWLGYANSFLNPVIYARFNRDFRTPFKEILCCRCRGINVRMRSESYVEQYGPDHVKDSLRPPAETMVRYNSHGQTLVQIGNGSANSQGEARI